MKKIFLTAVLLVFVGCSENASAMAVFDASNLAQNVLSAQEAIRHTQNQIQALANQLNQCKRMLQDAMNPAEFAWGDIQSTIDQLRAYPSRPRALIFRPAVNLRR